eukprot:TRINITY_DN5710_c0_g1_i1.p1 TRINITY_DN5710_c0_g1~~TRINITY_DN5710_c0_g1_i1.p1  ORF type:complete len:884 (+),score=396.15 TRINITY_DN5710_c0_g1_i1:78-2729(+)
MPARMGLSGKASPAAAVRSPARSTTSSKAASPGTSPRAPVSPASSPGGKKKARDSVNVAIRVRPHTFTDGGDNRTCVTMDEFGLTCKDPDGKKSDVEYAFDTIFPMTAEQRDVFEAVGVPMVDTLLDGFNVTLFTYGQTGSGKTYTIQGLPGAGVRKDQDYDIEKHKGLTPRVAEYLYQKMADIVEQDSSATTSLEMGYIEIYNECVRDLAVPKSPDLQVREDTDRKPFVEGLKWNRCVTPEQVMKHLLAGNTRRQVAATKMNEVSSRSHSIVMLKVKIKYDPPSADKPDTEALLYIVDLAGSERQDKTGAEGDTLTEAKNINKSLLMLGRAIHAFGEKGAAAHVPLRDSKLTRLLKESFGGNSKTWMIATCSASPYNMVETKSTLEYAQNAKLITNEAQQNRLARQLELSEQRSLNQKLENTIAQLKDDIEAVQAGAEEKARKMADDIARGQNEGVMFEMEELRKDLARKQKDLNESRDTEAELRTTIAKKVSSDVADQLRKELDEALAEIERLKKQLEQERQERKAAGATAAAGGGAAAAKGGDGEIADDPSLPAEERIRRMEARHLLQSAANFTRGKEKTFGDVYKGATGENAKTAYSNRERGRISIQNGHSVEDLTEAKRKAVAADDFAEAQRLSEEIQAVAQANSGESVDALQQKKKDAIQAENFPEAQKLQAQINVLKARQASMAKMKREMGSDYALPTPRPGLDGAVMQATKMFVGTAGCSLQFIIDKDSKDASRYFTMPLKVPQGVEIDEGSPPQLTVNIYKMERKADQPDDGRVDFVINVVSASGIPKEFSKSVHCKYVFKWDVSNVYKSSERLDTPDPEFNYKKRYAFPKLTDQLENWFKMDEVVTFEVIGVAKACSPAHVDAAALKGGPSPY